MKASQIVAAILTTVLDMKDEGAPSGILYMGLMTAGVDYSEYVSVIAILKDRGLITTKGNIVRLTESGEELARKVDAVLKDPHGRAVV